MRTALLGVWLVLLSLTLGCAGAGSRGAPELEGAWRLVTLDGEHVPAEAGMTLVLEEGRVQGYGGVNRFSGPLTLGPRDGFAAGPLVSTKRGGAPEANRRERRYLSRLQETKHARLVDGRLQLSDETRTLLVLER